MKGPSLVTWAEVVDRYMLELESEPPPQICHKCLGQQGSVRLVRDSAKAACRLCNSPFVTYHWKPNKQTLVCLECARKRDACQNCLRDAEFCLPLAIRDAALHIMQEEGGNESDRQAVLAAIAAEYAPTLQHSNAKVVEAPTLNEIVEALPEASTTRPAGCDTLYVYGIEDDLDSAELRAYFKAPLKRIEYLPASRLAIFEFEEAPALARATALIDGRFLAFAWANYVSIAPKYQPAVAAVVKSYLRQLLGNMA